jgi:hypothetical protein
VGSNGEMGEVCIVQLVGTCLSRFLGTMMRRPSARRAFRARFLGSRSDVEGEMSDGSWRAFLEPLGSGLAEDDSLLLRSNILVSSDNGSVILRVTPFGCCSSHVITAGGASALVMLVWDDEVSEL